VSLRLQLELSPWSQMRPHLSLMLPLLFVTLMPGMLKLMPLSPNRKQRLLTLMRLWLMYRLRFDLLKLPTQKLTRWWPTLLPLSPLWSQS
jgi:hypothetical protein